jgi:hypothetical protein
MIWLNSHSLHPVSKLDRRRTGRLRKRDTLLKGVVGMEEEQNHTTARKPGPKYYSILSDPPYRVTKYSTSDPYRKVQVGIEKFSKVNLLAD